jgi:hypothetical protein
MDWFRDCFQFTADRMGQENLDERVIKNTDIAENWPFRRSVIALYWRRRHQSRDRKLP